jgi:hypothetical protein
LGLGFNRVFYFGNSDETTTLYWSDVDALGFPKADEVPPTNALIVEEGETDQGTAVIEYGNVLYAFKEDSIFRITDSGDGNFSDELIYKGVGAVNQRSVVLAKNSIFFIDKNGLYFYRENEPQLVSPGLIDFFQDNVNQDEIGTRAFILYDKDEDTLLAFMPSSDSTYCDRCVVVDLRTGNVSIDLVPEVTCGYVDDTDIYLGTPYGQVLKYGTDYVDSVAEHYVGEVTL